MNLVSGNIRCMRIFEEVPLGGASNDSGVVDATAIFGDLGGYFLGNFRDKASNII